MSEISWIVLVLMIDVAHVYSTLYRTYFDPEATRQQKTILYSIPFIGFIAGVLLYSIDSLLFWRILAYTAVFHFVRQQYGFMRVYSRKERSPEWARRIDTLTIYTATLYPILYWHLSGQKNFNWFLENDFFYLNTPFLLSVFEVLYWLVISVYLMKEIILFVQTRDFNIPKFLVITGTLLSWYFGIVYFNGDLAFTLLNVVTHGVPYMALIWLFGQKNYQKAGRGTAFLRLIFSRKGLILFVGILILLAFVEEGLWDWSVWKEHRSIFGGGLGFSIPEKLLAFIVPLLALPQITHYILDGFIWKIKKEEFRWSNEIKNT